MNRREEQHGKKHGTRQEKRREKRLEKRQRKWAFVRRLNLTAMGITAAIYLVLAAFFSLMFLGLLLFGTQDISEENVVYTADLVDDQLKDLENYVHFCRKEIDNFSLMDDPVGKEAEIRELLEDFLHDKKEAVGCAVALNPAAPSGKPFMRYAMRATNGRVISMELDNPEEYDYTSMDWFTVPVESGKPSWSQPYYDLGAGNVLMCTYSCPLFVGGGDSAVAAPVAVLTLDIPLNQLERLADAVKYKDKGSVYMTTTQNLLLVHPDKACLMKPWVQPERKGQLVLRAEIPATGWILIYIIQRGERLQELRVFIWIALFVLVITLLILNSVMKRSIRRIALPEMEKQARMDTELDMAARIQRNMLPHSTHPFALHTDVDVRTFMQPAKTVGGDFYQYYLADRRLFFVVGDVSGKGVAAAVIMSMISERFLAVAPAASGPDEIVANINLRMAADNETGMFATMLLGMLDLDSGCCTFCNAGHNPPVVLPVDGRPYYLRLKENFPVGVVEDTAFETDSLQLADGMRILLYTDGLTEAENAAHELFGEKRLLEAVADVMPYQALMALEKPVQKAREFAAGYEQSDDITALCVQYTPSSPVINLLPQLGQLKYLTEFVEKLNLPEAVTMKVTLTLEEAFVNEVNYSGCSHIQLAAHKFSDASGNEVLRLTLTDNGKPFNPLSVQEKAPETADELNPNGGLGILMLKELSDRTAYVRLLGKNILTIEKIIQYGNKN